MKKVFFAVLAAAMCACAPKATVTVENSLGFDRSAEMVEIQVGELGRIALAEGQTYVVKNAAGEVVPSQVTSGGLLIFQSGLGAGEKTAFTVGAGAPQEFATRTKGRLAPERFDDFIWENDRVAFRIYGAALMAKDGPSNGIDALYKRTEDMIIDKWYVDELQNGLSYHSDHGTGLDDYNVRRTLGVGAAAPCIDGKLILNSNFTGQELLDNGPLRTVFRLTYPELEIAGVKVSETRTISIDAGSQLTRVVQEYGADKPMTVAVGYPLHADKVTYAAEGNILMVEEPATAKASGVYLGAILPVDFGEAFENEYEVPKGEKGAGKYRNILVSTPCIPKTPLVYYTGFGWEKWGDWTAEKFAGYLADFDAALETPLAINIR